MRAFLLQKTAAYKAGPRIFSDSKISLLGLRGGAVFFRPLGLFKIYWIFSKFTEFIRNSLVDPSKNSSWEQAVGQGHQRFTPEYVIKNQTKPHLRNYSFLHSHFLTSSQTKLLIPWTFFNVQYIIRYSEDSRKAMSRRRHRGFGSLHATALASKMRQQSDWTGKNYLFNIDCRWLSPVSV